MADLSPAPSDVAPPLSEDELRDGMELLYYAYRDFTAGPDAILADFGFGRAHHRVLYFVGRNPDITVGELLGILRITKQSLSRVLSQLVRQGFVTHRAGPADRRRRHLTLTPAGAALERRLAETQWALIERAYSAVGPAGVETYRRVLLGLINEADRAKLAERRRRP